MSDWKDRPMTFIKLGLFSTCYPPSNARPPFLAESRARLPNGSISFSFSELSFSCVSAEYPFFGGFRGMPAKGGEDKLQDDTY